MTLIPFPDFAQKGWECPKCGGVMSPSVSVCLYCVPRPSRLPASTTTNPVEPQGAER